VWPDADPPQALLEAELETGRTHQIRVHLGAPRLSARRATTSTAISRGTRALAREGLKRMFLHAHRIRFAHPIDDREVVVEAPLPPELTAYVARLDAVPMADPVLFAPRRFRFVVFDWDGTLADSTAIIALALQRACHDVGEPVPGDVDARYVIGLGLADALKHVAPGLRAERYPELATRYRHHYFAHDGSIPLFGGVRELLAEMDAAGYLLGVATGKSRAGLDRALAQHEVGSFFAATRCADEGFAKPHPDMLLRLMDRVGVRPGQYVDDRRTHAMTSS
jgi:phosphoglycolate phosphatase